MEDPDAASPLQAMADPDSTSLEAAMQVPITVRLGPVGSLFPKLHLLTAPGHTADEIRLLRDGLKVLCVSLKNMSEDEEASFMARWWMKIVRELCYDTEDHLDKVSSAGAHLDFSELLARSEDARSDIKSFKRPLKTSEPDSGGAGVSRLTSQMSPELAVPLGVHSKLMELLALGEKTLKVISIHGCAGVGKTTVARTLYHKHGGKFQCRAFVGLSRNLDMRAFLTTILSQLKAPRPHVFADVSDLIDAINKHLQGKRYFIIIDDLWTASVWDIIIHAFPRGDYCSRIITTTQIDDVALACCSYNSDYIYKMEPLNDRESKMLFFGRVFGSEDGCPTRMKEDSYKIIRKCGGLPLPIVKIASLLACKSDMKHIQDSLPSTSEGMKDVLNLLYNSLPHLMYNSLPPRLRTCLLYLSMYAHGYVIKRDELVNQWVAEGLFLSVGNTEEIAEAYFDELVSRGMVQAVDTNKNGEVLSCTVHQMVLDFITYKSMEENFVITVDYLQSTLALPDKVRRLSIQFGGAKGAYIPEGIVTSQVRSLIFWGFFKCVPSSIMDNGLLRVLILHIWADREKKNFDLTTIGKLSLLKYVKIECNITVKLPGKIRRLQYLGTLQLDARLSAVPSDIVRLERLLHLRLPSESILPRVVSQLTSLRTLGYFDISSYSEKNVLNLGRLTNLQDLQLTCSAVRPAEKLEKNVKLLGSILEKLRVLQSLTLVPAASGSSCVNILRDGFAMASPPPDLLLRRIELSRRCCIFFSLPKWFGELRKLCILKIAIMELSKDDIDVLKGLSSLTALTLYIQTPHAGRILIEEEGFLVLTYFKFMCAAPCLSFAPKAMPKVQKLKLGFNANKMKRHSIQTAGISKLTGLTDICVKLGDAEESHIKDAESKLESVFSDHPNTPVIRVQCVDVIVGAVDNQSTATEENEIQNASASSGLAMDGPDAASLEAARQVPITVMLGPVGPLLRHSLMVSGQSLAPDLLSADEIRRLKVLCISLKDMSEDEEASFMVRGWMKMVREIVYDTEDGLEEVAGAGAHHDFSALLARAKDASERRKCIEWSPPKTIKPADPGEAAVSRLTSLELPVPLPVHVEPPNKLVELLDLDDGEKTLKVVPIYGCAGVGKTTAARALNHRHAWKFQCRAFVTMSRNPDIRGVLTSILSQLKAPWPHGFPDVPQLIDAISKHLRGKRYLVVIDDLWEVSEWKTISSAFPRGYPCSRILTTTQINDVALACSDYSPDYIYKMQPLNDHESTKLFFGRVFGSEDGCPTDIKEVSYEIIMKCGGLPLAIVSIASLLASESNIVREKWKHIQDSLPSTSEGMKDVLNLIYSSLPPRLRTCLLYLSMYAHGYVIKKDELLKLWVAEGFLSAVGERGPEEIAEGYFDELVNRGMVQAVDTDNNGKVLSCSVHQIVLDFIRHKSREENFVITVDYNQSTLTLPDKVRRLSVQFGGVKSAYIPESIVTSHVRSLIFWGFFKYLPTIMDYGFLRVLVLHIWADQEKKSFDLTGIGELFLLKYLKIESNITVKLPDKIRGLQRLETLQVDARLSAVPSDIVSLPRMLYLSLPSDADMPSGIGRMTSLHTLGYFDLSNNPADSVKDLDHLTNLGDLHLTCAKLDTYNLQNNIKLLGSVLGELISLKCLTLAPADSSDINTLADAGASSMGICFDGLRLKLGLKLWHQEASRPWALQRLELSRHCCTFSRLPEWIGILLNLRILKIAIRELSEEDIHVLKGLRFLTALTLYIQTAPADRIVIKEGFEVLTYFKFMCAAPCLSFVPGAMPKVQKIKLGFNLNKKRSESDSINEAACFHHLTGLTEISVKFGTRGADEFRIKYEESALEAAFRNAPNSPTIRVQCVDVIFCAEEDKCTATDEQEEKRQGIEQDKENIREHESRYPRTDRVFTALMHHAQSVDLVTGASNTLPLCGERPPTPTVVEHSELDRLEMVDPVSLVGMILSVVPLIVRAAETARQNKKKCLDLAQRAGTLANVLPNYIDAAANDQETARLQTLKEALDEAFTLIQSCQRPSIFSRSRKAAELDGVNRKINECITDLNFIRNARPNHVTAASSVPAQTYDHGSYYQYQAQGGGASSSACVGFPPPHHAPVNVHWTPASSPYHASPAPSGYNLSSFYTLPTVNKIFDRVCNGFR